MTSDVSPQKTPIWASICTPVAPSLLISSGHSPRLGGHNFGGARPRYAPRGAGSDLLQYNYKIYSFGGKVTFTHRRSQGRREEGG